MTLIEKLNKYEVTHNTGKDGVTLEACPQDDSLFDSEGFVTDDEFSKFLEDLNRAKAYVEDHPLDRRAGLVVFVELDGETAWYDENGECAWVE